mgnify:CR=1 FL=1
MGSRTVSLLAPTCAGLAFLCAGVLLALDDPQASGAATRAPLHVAPTRAGLEQVEELSRAPLDVERSALSSGTELRVSGAVVDLGGASVASLSLVRRSGDERVELGPCGADGRFAWPSEPSGGALWIEHPGWICVQGARVDAPAEASARTLVVARETAFFGRVSCAGVAAPKARVAVVLDRPDAAGPVWAGASGSTDADGRFELAGVPRGAPLSVRVSQSGCVARSFEFAAAPERFVELELEPLGAEFGRLRGLVLTHAGAPADQQTSVVWGRDGVRCNADGTFELALRHDPGDAPIVVRARGMSEAQVPPAWDHVRSGEPLELRQGPPFEDLVGWIRAADEASELKGCVVELRRQAPDGAPLARTRADANGRYEFRGLERGEYWVRAESGPASASVGPIPSGGRAPELFISR